jgi:hypothetical protein
MGQGESPNPGFLQNSIKSTSRNKMPQNLMGSKTVSDGHTLKPFTSPNKDIKPATTVGGSSRNLGTSGKYNSNEDTALQNYKHSILP